MSPDWHFNELLRVARSQPEQQRLLFVFASAELPEDATPEQRRNFRSGNGGALAPRMCVDKAATELQGFAALAEEARQVGPPWSVMFAASLGGEDGRAPDSARIDLALETMVQAIREGRIAGYAAYGPTGAPLQIS